MTRLGRPTCSSYNVQPEVTRCALEVGDSGKTRAQPERKSGTGDTLEAAGGAVTSPVRRERVPRTEKSLGMTLDGQAGR